MFCQNCGAQNTEQAKFCKNCGFAINGMGVITQRNADHKHEAIKKTLVVFTGVVSIFACGLWIYFFISYLQGFEFNSYRNTLFFASASSIAGGQMALLMFIRNMRSLAQVNLNGRAQGKDALVTTFFLVGSGCVFLACALFVVFLFHYFDDLQVSRYLHYLFSAQTLFFIGLQSYIFSMGFEIKNNITEIMKT